MTLPKCGPSYMSRAPLVLRPEALTAELCGAVQHLAHETVEARSVARRFLPVVCTPDTVPQAVRLSDPTRAGVAAGGLQVCWLETKARGMLLWSEFTVDLLTAETLSKDPTHGDLSQMTEAVEDMVWQEDSQALSALAEAARAAAEPSPIGSQVVDDIAAVADALTDQWASPQLALVVWGDLRKAVIGHPELKRLRALLTAGIYPARPPRPIQPPDPKAGKSAGPEATGLIVDTGCANGRLLVGKNYEVSWVGRHGPGHKFGIALGLAASVVEHPKVQVLTYEASPPRPRARAGR